jgi:hypothetical protein
MVASTRGLGPEKDCVRKTQQHIQKTDPSSRQRGRPTKQDRNCQIVMAKYLVMSPRWGSTPRLTDWLTVSRNVTLTLALAVSNPCGGGVEYFHRDPVSRRRWRKVKSQIWDSKIWSRVPRDSDPGRNLFYIYVWKAFKFAARSSDSAMQIPSSVNGETGSLSIQIASSVSRKVWTIVIDITCDQCGYRV